MTLLKCTAADCGFRFFDLDEWVYPYSDRDYYSDWDASALRPDSPFIKARVALLKRFVKQGRVADLGCGIGETAIRLMREGYDVCAVDESRKSIDVLRKRYPDVEWVCGELGEFLDTQPGRFAAVTMFHTLEHVPRPGRIIAAVTRVLHDDGAIVIEVPDAGGGQARLRGAEWDYFSQHHVNYFDVRSLTRLMSKYGYQRRYLERTFHFSFPQGHLAKDIVKGILGRIGYNAIIRTVWTKAR